MRTNPFRLTLVFLVALLMLLGVASVFAPKADAQEYVPLNPADGISAADFPYPADGHVHSCSKPQVLSYADCAKKVDDMQWSLEFNHGLLGLARYSLQEKTKDYVALDKLYVARGARITSLEARVKQLEAQLKAKRKTPIRNGRLFGCTIKGC